MGDQFFAVVQKSLHQSGACEHARHQMREAGACTRCRDIAHKTVVGVRVGPAGPWREQQRQSCDAFVDLRVGQAAIVRHMGDVVVDAAGLLQQLPDRDRAPVRRKRRQVLTDRIVQRQQPLLRHGEEADGCHVLADRARVEQRGRRDRRLQARRGHTCAHRPGGTGFVPHHAGQSGPFMRLMQFVDHALGAFCPIGRRCVVGHGFEGLRKTRTSATIQHRHASTPSATVTVATDCGRDWGSA